MLLVIIRPVLGTALLLMSCLVPFVCTAIVLLLLMLLLILLVLLVLSIERERQK